MRISGFSFVKNGISLYYPVVESIRSILPLVDEFVIAVGRGDNGDTTRDAIAAINSPKISIIDTVWDESHFKRGASNAIQTDIAKKACSGDWLFYLQADEVVHEDSLEIIHGRCAEYLDTPQIEGLLFKYYHFWGDYSHYHTGHGWYPKEIRIVRNRNDIHSWESAQSFRKFDYYEHPHQPHGHHKLTVAPVNAHIYHYGWVRPPHLMQTKRKALDTVHIGKKDAHERYSHRTNHFDYGPLDRLSVFKGTHPAVMNNKIAELDWQDTLQYHGKPDPTRELYKHERLKYRLLSFIERVFFNRNQICGFKNYRLAKNLRSL